MIAARPNTVGRLPMIGFGVLALLQLLFLLVVRTGVKEFYVLAIGLLPILLLMMLQFRILFLALPAFLFLNLHFYGFSASEFIAAVVILAFLLTHARISRADLGSAPFAAILLYLLLLFVSMVQSIEPLTTLVLISHFVIFTGLVLVIGSSVRDTQTLERLITVFIALVTLNSLHVLVLAAITGSRVFGFAGIMFVDYVGIAVVIAFIRALFARTERQRITAVLLLFLFTVALVLTQTRTSWISTFIVIAIMMLLVARNESSLGLPVGMVKRYAVNSGMVLIAVLLLALVFNPSTFDRLADVSSGSDQMISETGVVKNSLVSRLLIWHTAYNGFMAHPILGIGAYSFPLTSMHLYTIPEELYILYVDTLTPHQTYIAVAVETGIIGLIVFSAMIFSILRYTWRLAQRHWTHPDRQILFSFSGGVLYITVSMITTDAWLWGHGVVLFALLLGSMIAFERISSGAR